jgi:hypothetical protein
MRIDKTTQNNMKQDIIKLVNHCWPNCNFKEWKEEDAVRKMWNIWFKVFMSKKYEDNNPNVVFLNNGDRLFERDMNAMYVPDGCYDEHVESALKKIYEELCNE